MLRELLLRGVDGADLTLPDTCLEKLERPLRCEVDELALVCEPGRACGAALVDALGVRGLRGYRGAETGEGALGGTPLW